MSGPGTTQRAVAPEAATTTRAAVLALQRRMQTLEGQVRPHVTEADIRDLQTQVRAPLEAARGIMGQEGASMAESEYRNIWQLISQSAAAWERLRASWASPTRIVTVPMQQAIEQAQSVVEAARELAPQVGVAAAAGMVIAALAGLWVLTEVGKAAVSR